MTSPPSTNRPRKGRTGNPRGRHDKELVRERTLEVLERSLGPGREQGARMVWDCPACGKREKYSVVKASGKGGCLVADCRLHGSDDVFGMLAGLEGLDYHADFRAVLARAYELLGLDEDAGGQAPGGQGAMAAEPRQPRAVPVRSRNEARQDDGGGHDLQSALALASKVYERILEICPLESRDRTYLKEERGLSYETIKKARFGTMTAGRARKLKGVLQREFGREELLRVPGFTEDGEEGRLKWTLTGDFILIPYHDAGGAVTTIEGRIVGKQAEGDKRKYVSLRRAGNHLYLFPGHRPEELFAVTEGAMGAIVAAEAGLYVGAIMGCERFRASPSPEMLDGGPEDPLLEIKGADFAGRTVPYIPDCDDPPNANVLRAAPKAARWIAEPQNGRPAVCLLPRGVDLDEWLLSLPPEQRGQRFAELLAAASPPKDAITYPAAPAGREPQTPPAPETNGTQDQPVTPDVSHKVPPKPAPSEGAPEPADDDTALARAQGGGPARPPVPGPEDGAGATDHDPAASLGEAAEDAQAATKTPAPAKAASKETTGSAAKRRSKADTDPKAGTEKEQNRGAAPPAQPGLWDAGNADDGGSGGQAGRRGVSRGARKLRDEVYGALLQMLPPKEEHLEALAKEGVMRRTAEVGRLASLDRDRAKELARALPERFGAKRLLSVPGFEADGAGKVRFSVPSSEHPAEEYVLLPCFDGEGLVSAIEALPLDPKTGELGTETTVPLKDAGAHLYVFAYHSPKDLEGFCEGPLGALLAAQHGVVVGAIGGFRRYKAASGPAEGRQPKDAPLPELEGLNFDGRALPYVPRAGAGVGEANARYHEAEPAARWLAERQGGRPAVVGLVGKVPENEAEAANGANGEGSPADAHAGPTSLGEWVLSLPEDDVYDALRQLFPERSAGAASGERADDDHHGADEGGSAAVEEDSEERPPLPARAAYAALGIAFVVAALLSVALARLEAFSAYVDVGPGGDPLLYGGLMGPLRKLAATPPFEFLYAFRFPVALAGGLLVGLLLYLRARREHLARWKAARVRLGERWDLHLVPVRRTPARVPVTPGEAVFAALAWPIGFLLSGWLIGGTEALLSLAARLEMAPAMGPLVADRPLVSTFAATALSAFVLWRRYSIRSAEARMIAGKIRH